MAVEIREIRIDKIQPNYRLIYEEDIIIELVNDIKSNGLLEPITVELVEYCFRIVDGEKRWRACKRIGMTTVRAEIHEASE
jgi:ParB family chromosome partitioning protein